MRSLLVAILTLAAFTAHAQTADPANAVAAAESTPAATQDSSSAAAQSTTESSAPEQPAATPPASQNSSGQPAAPTPAAPAVPATGRSPAIAPVVPVARDEPFEPPIGYHKEKRKYGEVWCRNEGEIGTRFVKKRCYTQQDLEYKIAREKEMSDELQQRSRVCSSAAVCANN